MPRTTLEGTSKIIETICNGDDVWDFGTKMTPFKLANERMVITIDQCQQIYFRYLKVQGGLF
jgi:hypothetical protein